MALGVQTDLQAPPPPRTGPGLHIDPEGPGKPMPAGV